MMCLHNRLRIFAEEMEDIGDGLCYITADGLYDIISCLSSDPKLREKFNKFIDEF